MARPYERATAGGDFSSGAHGALVGSNPLVSPRERAIRDSANFATLMEERTASMPEPEAPWVADAAVMERELIRKQELLDEVRRVAEKKAATLLAMVADLRSMVDDDSLDAVAPAG